MATSSAPRAPAAGVLLAALVAAVAYAAYADGAVGIPEETRVQVGLAAVGLLAAVGWLWTGALRPRASGLAWAGLGLLAAFAVWSAVSVLWSVAPDRTWTEVNRALAYSLAALLAVAVGASLPHASRRVAVAYLVLATVTAAYALGGKVAPGLHVDGLFDLDQTARVPRLRAPLQYWNALALLLALAVPAALRLAAGAVESRRGRLAALLALEVLLVAIGLTYSRGGLVALVVGIAVALALGGGAARALPFLGLAVLAAAAPAAFAFARDDLTSSGISLGERADDGLILGGLLALSLVGLALAGRWLMADETRLALTPAAARTARRAAVGAVAAAAVLGIGALALSDRGLTGTVSHEWERFTEVKEDRQTDPARLLSTNGGNRWVWWKEAVGAWSDKPVGGWGAGAFPVVHKRYRTNSLDVLQPHSVPLQFLAEVGLVGALLGLGALAALAGAAVSEVRRRAPGPDRALAAALVGAGAAWLVHMLYDWDWDIPGVALPMLVLLGVAAARPRPPGPEPLEPRGDPGGWRAPALAGAAVLLATVTVSAVLPAWSKSKADSALVALGARTSRADAERAARRARVAADLNPLAVDGLFTAASVAESQGRFDAARDLLVEAAERQPDNVNVWFKLVRVSEFLGDLPGARRAALRALELDPRARFAQATARRLAAFTSPPRDSPTATGTPLPAAPVAPPAVPPGTPPATP